ncbi:MULTISPECIES: hypothetical protein [Shewanella]|nr:MULTISPECIES: hypothetical protein [Shewanella]
MGQFIKNNLGLILVTALIFGGICGGIWYVEHSLESQERVLD